MLFHQQSGFQTQDLWLSFVLKAFDFISRAKLFLKINLVLKEKGIASDLLNKTIAKRFYLHPFQKNSKKMNLQVLKENAIIVKALSFKREK